jgi:hypothetical protein
MSIPPPSRTRAVIVGLEDYERLGRNWRLPGSSVDAERMRTLLHECFDVQLKNITTFLAPLDPLRIDALGARQFTRDTFDKFLENELAKDEAGGTLILCWSGHGFYSKHDGVLHLISSEATDGAGGQLRSIDFKSLAQMLIGAPYAHFTHQVLIVSTCRSPIDAAAPNVLRFSAADPDPARAVRQCQLYACAEGQTARQSAAEGSLLVREVLTGLSQASKKDRTTWPEFVELLVLARDAVVDASRGHQSPAVFAAGWDGGTLAGAAGPFEPPLTDTIAGLHWSAQRLRLHALRCLDAHSTWPGEASLDELTRIVPFLDDLPQIRGWPPLVEFVVRLNAASGGNESLERWLDKHSQPGVRGDIAAYCDDENLGHVLQLWQHDATSLKAALFDADNQLVRDAWDIEVGIPVQNGDLNAAIGAWIEKAHHVLGDSGVDLKAPLILELCIPQESLGNDIDCSEVIVFGDRVVLNRKYGALLRGVERLKAQSTLSILKRTALSVLHRASRSNAMIRWAAPAQGRSELLRGLFKAADDAPVWIALPSPAGARETHKRQLQICLDGPAPAVFWLRPDVPEAERADVETELKPLLRQAGADLPHRLLDWRLEQIGCSSEQVALLIDDPRRTPPWTTRLGQPVPVIPKLGSTHEP